MYRSQWKYVCTTRRLTRSVCNVCKIEDASKHHFPFGHCVERFFSFWWFSQTFSGESEKRWAKLLQDTQRRVRFRLWTPASSSWTSKVRDMPPQMQRRQMHTTIFWNEIKWCVIGCGPCKFGQLWLLHLFMDGVLFPAVSRDQPSISRSLVFTSLCMCAVVMSQKKIRCMLIDSSMMPSTSNWFAVQAMLPPAYNQPRQQADNFCCFTVWRMQKGRFSRAPGQCRNWRSDLVHFAQADVLICSVSAFSTICSVLNAKMHFASNWHGLDSAVAVCHAFSHVVSFLVRSPRRSHERFKHSSSDENPGYLLYIRDNTTLLYRGYS